MVTDAEVEAVIEPLERQQITIEAIVDAIAMLRKQAAQIAGYEKQLEMYRFSWAKESNADE